MTSEYESLIPTPGEAEEIFKTTVLPDAMMRVAEYVGRELTSRPGPYEYVIQIPQSLGSYELIRAALSALFVPLGKKGWVVTSTAGNIDQTEPLKATFRAHQDQG